MWFGTASPSSGEDADEATSGIMAWLQQHVQIGSMDVQIWMICLAGGGLLLVSTMCTWHTSWTSMGMPFTALHHRLLLLLHTSVPDMPSSSAAAKACSGSHASAQDAFPRGGHAAFNYRRQVLAAANTGDCQEHGERGTGRPCPGRPHSSAAHTVVVAKRVQRRGSDAQARQDQGQGACSMDLVLWAVQLALCAQAAEESQEAVEEVCSATAYRSAGGGALTHKGSSAPGTPNRALRVADMV